MSAVLARFTEEVFSEPTSPSVAAKVFEYALLRAGPELVDYIEGRSGFARLSVVFSCEEPRYAGVFFPLTHATDASRWIAARGRAIETLVLLRFANGRELADSLAAGGAPPAGGGRKGM